MVEIKGKKLAEQIEKHPITKKQFETVLKKVCKAKKPQSSPKPSGT